MGTGGNFEDKLKLVRDKDPANTDVHVEAMGPTYGNVVELSVWVIQKQGASDAAAAQFTQVTGRPGLTSPTLADGTTGWGLLARQVSVLPLKPGYATAMAIALFLEDGEQKAQFWAQSVELV
jgi:hypothetical protein